MKNLISIKGTYFFFFYFILIIIMLTIKEHFGNRIYHSLSLKESLQRDSVCMLMIKKKVQNDKLLHRPVPTGSRGFLRMGQMADIGL